MPHVQAMQDVQLLCMPLGNRAIDSAFLHVVTCDLAFGQIADKCSRNVQIAEPEGFGKKGSTKQPKAAFADGTALPAKRPRTSKTAEPDAARSNERAPAITDFFNSVTSEVKAERNASDSHDAEARLQTHRDSHLDQLSVATPAGQCHPVQVPSTHDAVQQPFSLTGADGGTLADSAHQSPVQHVNLEAHGSARDDLTSAERKRKLMADAATRRLTAQQHAVSSSELHPADSATEPNQMQPDTKQEGMPQAALDPSAVVGQASHADSIAHVSAVIDLVDDDNDAVGLGNSTQQESEDPCNTLSTSQQPSCPMCGHRWSVHTSDADINKHVDACLGMQLL